jgi:type VII secretion-associated serine protease mycosin
LGWIDEAHPPAARRPAQVALAGGWAVPARADAVRDKQWHLGYLRIAEAHQISQGEGVTVGLVDTGVDASHPDLAGSVLPGADVWEGAGDGRIDPDGHGTSMAGLIVAHGSGNSGALGIAPKAKIVSVRAGTTKYFSGSTEHVANGIKAAVQHGVKVISVSFGGNEIIPLDEAIAAAAAADVVVVAAAGNRPGSPSVRAPASYDGVVAVAGTDRAGNHAEISATGPKVAVSAPATDIMSTDPGGKYSAGNGTSNSAAIVAGVVALIRAKYPKLTAKQVIERLTATAVDKGSPGRDSEFGYGIVDPVAALTKTVKPSASATSPAPGGRTAPSEDDSDGTRILVMVLLAVGLVLAVGTTAGLLVWTRRKRRERWVPPPGGGYYPGMPPGQPYPPPGQPYRPGARPPGP